jgi:hypothetical protein
MQAAFQQTRSALFQWAAKNHATALKAGVDLYFGGEPRTEDGAYAAIAFALATPAADGPSLTELFAAAHGHLPRAQRTALAAWKAGRFGLFEVVIVHEDKGLELIDVFSDGDTFFVDEKAATHSLEAGDWLAAFVVPVERHFELEGTLELVPPPCRLAAIRAAIDTVGDLSAVSSADTRRAARPVIQAMRAALKPPRLENSEGHPLTAIEAVIAGPWEALEAELATWPDARRTAFGWAVLGGEHLGAPVLLANFESDTRILFANSRARFDHFAARLGERGFTLEAEVENPPVPPLSDELRVYDAVWPDGAEDVPPWEDMPNADLGGLTPRAAVEAGRFAEVRALVPDDPEDAMDILDALDL